MVLEVVRGGARRTVLVLLLLCGAVGSSFPAFALQSVTLAWNPSPDTNVVGYKIHYGTGHRFYTAVADAGSASSVTISGLMENRTYYFSATAYDTNNGES